jgi:spore coat polysaccharide biosynthesis protein SpsF
MRAVAIVQARTGSTRLPGKVLMDVAGEPLLVRVVERLRRASGLAAVVVATSTEPADEAILDLCRERRIPAVAGSERDVLDRYRTAAAVFEADPVVRVTADCPLLDPALVERVLETYATGTADHVGIAAGMGAADLDAGRYPSGVDCECFSRAALEQAWRSAHAPDEREHVTPYIWRRPGTFRLASLRGDRDLGHLHWSVDTAADLAFARTVYARLGDRFGIADVLALLAAEPGLVHGRAAA